MNLNIPGYTGTSGGLSNGGLNIPGYTGTSGGLAGGGLNIPTMGNANISPALAAATAGGTGGFGQIAGGLGNIFSGLMGAGQSVLNSPDALMGLAGGLLTKESYDRLSDIGSQAKQEAMGLAERGQRESQFKPFTVTTPTGAMFTSRMGGQPRMGQPMAQPVLTYQPLELRGEPSMMLPPGGGLGQQLKQLDYVDTMPVDSGPTEEERRAERQRFLAMSPQEIQQFESLGGISPLQQPVRPTTGGLQVGMTLSPQEQALQQQLLTGAGGLFGQAAQPTMDREQAVFERIRAAQRPEEQRQRLALEERLAAQGRLGTSSAAYGGATPELMAQQTAIQESRNQAMLSAMQQAQAEQAQQAALGQTFLGSGYMPQQALLEAAMPGIMQQELAQQGQQFGTGLFAETGLSGIEAQLLQEQARANLLGGIGGNLISGIINQQRAATAAPSGGGGSSLGGLFGDIVGGLGDVGSGIKSLLGIGG